MARKTLHGNVVATKEGEEMGQKKFQLDETKADLNNDGELSSYERARGEAVQKAMAESNATEMMMGGLMMDSDPFAPMQVVIGMDAHSGNEVPAGSKDEEVRDDIPALLSEGEYVVPADVVRYHGLKTFEELRCEAKHALGLMAMHDRISMVDEDTKEPVEYDIEEEDAPEVEKAEVKVVEAQEGTSVESTAASEDAYNYILQYVKDPVTGMMTMAYVDPMTGQQISKEEYDISRATRFSPQKILERDVYGITPGEEEEEDDTTTCPPGYTYDDALGQCVPIVTTGQVATGDGGDDRDDGPEGRGTLGLTEVEVDDIFSEISPEYDQLMKSIEKPSGFGVLNPAFAVVEKVVNGVRKSLARTDVRDMIREGKNSGITPSTDVKPGFDTSYADWRSEIDTYTAASIAISEKEAQRVSSGSTDENNDWRDSQYGSQAEADAVANSGWGSADVFDAIDPNRFDEPGGGQFDFSGTRAGLEDQGFDMTTFEEATGPDWSGDSDSDKDDDKDDDDGVSDSVGSDPDDWSGGGEEWNKGGMPYRKNTPRKTMIKYSKGSN